MVSPLWSARLLDRRLCGAGQLAQAGGVCGEREGCSVLGDVQRPSVAGRGRPHGGDRLSFGVVEVDLAEVVAVVGEDACSVVDDGIEYRWELLGVQVAGSARWPVS
ncbi:hypothetical protein AB1285_26715 [Microbacterium sp. NRRL B-14842]|uniref:hypothetical protein n=1 Tax=Microbacterium sp. NRRL B-14842 TaxID=3162881 RepID=UPI003D28B6B9